MFKRFDLSDKQLISFIIFPDQLVSLPQKVNSPFVKRKLNIDILNSLHRGIKAIVL